VIPAHQAAQKLTRAQHPPFFLAEPLAVPGFKREPRGVLQEPQMKYSGQMKDLAQLKAHRTIAWTGGHDITNAFLIITLFSGLFVWLFRRICG